MSWEPLFIKLLFIFLISILCPFMGEDSYCDFTNFRQVDVDE